jgi:hypothetical protein
MIAATSGSVLEPPMVKGLGPGAEVFAELKGITTAGSQYVLRVFKKEKRCMFT